MLDTVREVSTPELVALHLRVAGPVPRALAWVIDGLLRLGVIFVCGMALGALGRFGWGLMAILYFLLEWFYPVAFEVWSNGATPGKRALGLVVVNDDGTPVGWGPSLTRNLLRAADFLPFAYGIGLFSMFVSSEFRRLGDILAGTLVLYRETAPTRSIMEAPPVVPLVPLSRETQRTQLALAECVPRLTPARAAELAALVPHLTDGTRGAEAVQRLLGIANHLAGRRA
jgi:uncharacterized RDD family membrane protein YckC